MGNNLANWAKTGAVLGANSVGLQGFLVEGGTIADVFLEAIGGILGSNFGHIAVASDFGDDRSG